MSKSSPKRIILSVLKWILSGAMLAYALHEIDGAAVKHMLAHQDPLFPLAVIALMIFQMYISTFRWQHILQLLGAGKLAFAKLFRFNYASIFFNSCLPGTIGGDVVRAMLLKAEHVPLHVSAHSVIIDRLLAVIAIYVMVTVSLPWLADVVTLPLGPLFCLSVGLIVVGILFLRRAPEMLSKLPSKHMIRMTVALLQDVRKVLFCRTAPVLLAQAVFAHGCFCTAIYLLAQSVGAPITFWDTLVMIPPVLLIIMLPISMGGWGVREVSMVGMLALVGVPKEAALTISVQMGILGIIASLPGAYFYAKRQKHAAAGISAQQS